MTESQLNGLAHLYIHRDIPVDPDRIIDELARKHQRRMHLRDLLLLMKLTDNFLQTFYLL